jgi:hypothetical protein
MSRVDTAKDAEIRYRNEVGQTYSLTVEALKRFILFSIVELTDRPAGQSSGASSIGS